MFRKTLDTVSSEMPLALLVQRICYMRARWDGCVAVLVCLALSILCMLQCEQQVTFRGVRVCQCLRVCVCVCFCLFLHAQSISIAVPVILLLTLRRKCKARIF